MSLTTLYVHEALKRNREPLLADYPIFDESKRVDLNEKIFDAYMNREIGQETISMWVFALNRKMRQIMPYYNQLYKSEQLKFDPLNSIDIRTFTEAKNAATSTDTTKAKADEESTSDSDSVSNGRTVNYSYPQEMLEDNGRYGSSGQDSESKSTATAGAKGNSTSESDSQSATEQDGTSESTTAGFQGNRAQLLMDYRATILNIDMDVIRELEPCFLQVMSTGDSFVNERYYWI